MAAEQGAKSVEAGILQANTAGQAIQSLAQSVEYASQSAIQIAASGQQQMAGMDQVASAMESIKQASIQNLAAVRQTEDSVRMLHEIGIKLKQDADRYASDVECRGMGTKEDDFRQRLAAAFRAEAAEHVAAISSGLSELDRPSPPTNAQVIIETTFREMHTSKCSPLSERDRDRIALPGRRERSFRAQAWED